MEIDILQVKKNKKWFFVIKEYMKICENLQEQLEKEKSLRIETVTELTNIKESYKRLEQELKHKVNKSENEDLPFQRKLSKINSRFHLSLKIPLKNCLALLYGLCDELIT